jgi:predicted Zn-dependent protease
LIYSGNNIRFFVKHYGGMAEWFKAAVLKTVERKLRGFESYSLRHEVLLRGEMAELAEGARLLSECGVISSTEGSNPSLSASSKSSAFLLAHGSEFIVKSIVRLPGFFIILSPYKFFEVRTMSKYSVLRFKAFTVVQILAVLGLYFSWGCATNPATGRTEFMLVSEEKEFQIGQQVDKEVRGEMGVYVELPDLRSKVKEITENIGRHSDRPSVVYRAEIVDTPDFNAFAVPGGFIYVHRGLLERMNSADELASVIGHEIGHVAARHSAAQISKMQILNIGLIGAQIATHGALQDYGGLIDLGSILAFSKFSRDDEREADCLGIKYMSMAGYNPKASISVMRHIQTLENTEPSLLDIWFMTHPPTNERLELLNKELEEMSYQDPVILNRDIRRNTFIRLLDGLVVGEYNGTELVSGDRYFNKEFLLSIPIPQGWQAHINNADYTAIFADTKQESFVYFDIRPLQRQKTTEAYFKELSKSLTRQGLRMASKTAEPDNLSLGAMAGTYQGSTSALGPIKVRLIAFTREHNGFSMIGLGKEEEFEKLQPLFESMITGLDFLSQEEISGIDVPRMRVHEVSVGETWDDIAIQYFSSSEETEKLAEYNGLTTDKTPAPGILLKIPPSLRFR